MADFCKDCHEALFGDDLPNDLEGMSTAQDTADGLYADALCEGCGYIQVDHTGKRVWPAPGEGEYDDKE